MQPNSADVITFHSSTIYTIVNNRRTYIRGTPDVFEESCTPAGPNRTKRFTSWSSVLRRMFRRDVGHRSHSQEDSKIDVAPEGARARTHARTIGNPVVPRSFDLPVVEGEEEEEEERRRRKKKGGKRKRKRKNGGNRERLSTRVEQVSTSENTDAP